VLVSSPTVFATVEPSTVEEVGFHRPETSFFTGFSIGMIESMTGEREAIASGEGLHLRNDHGLFSRPAKTSQIRVVDDALPGRDYQLKLSGQRTRLFASVTLLAVFEAPLPEVPPRVPSLRDEVLSARSLDVLGLVR